MPAWVGRIPACVVSRTGLLVCLLLGVPLGGGCARPDVIHLYLGGLAVEAPAEAQPGALRVVVLPFEDRRGGTSFVGLRSPLAGDPQELHLETADAGRLAADLMSQVLRAQGWRAEVADSRTEPPEADVVLTGAVLELVVDADGALLQTTIRAQSKVVIEALNAADGSTVRQTLTGLGSQGVFWFEPEDAEALVGAILLDSYGKLVHNTHVDGRVLRLK